MEFKLPELVALSQGINYNPLLSTAINRMLNARTQKEYEESNYEATKIAIGYQNINVRSRKDYGQSSTLIGMPLFMPLTIKNTDDENDFMLLESAVVELSRTKNIVSTIIQGRDGSVDEFINNGDWNITVTGMLCLDGPAYPLNLVTKLEHFLGMKKPLKIEHESLNALSIYEIVVLSENPIIKSAHINVQPYSFTAKSSKPLPLIIQDKPNNQII